MQVFEDIEFKLTQTTSENLLLDTAAGSPLLVMVYEFERGEGTMEMCAVDTFNFLSTTTPVVDL